MARSKKSWSGQFVSVQRAEYLSAQAIESAYASGRTAESLNQALADIRRSLPEKPRYIRAHLAQYQAGYRKCFEAGKLAFLYLYKGAFYSVSTSAAIGYPSWKSLPESEWLEIGKHGAFYWIYPDKPPALNF